MDIFLNCCEGLKTEHDGWPAPSPTMATNRCVIFPWLNVEITEIENALAAFKTEVASGASGGALPDRLIKE
jgi:hypothetical protein